MSDSLRDKIAAALMTADSTDAERYELADAVIRELGRYEYAVATKDREFVCMYADERSELDGLQLHPDEQIVRRYVTEWEPDE